MECNFPLLEWYELWTDKMIIYCWTKKVPLLIDKIVVIILIKPILPHRVTYLDSDIFQNAFNPLLECIHHLQILPTRTHAIKCTWGLWQIRVVRCSLNWTGKKQNLILHRGWSLSFTWAEQSVETWLWLKCPLQLAGNTQLTASSQRDKMWSSSTGAH